MSVATQNDICPAKGVPWNEGGPRPFYKSLSNEMSSRAIPNDYLYNYSYHYFYYYYDYHDYYDYYDY